MTDIQHTYTVTLSKRIPVWDEMEGLAWEKLTWDSIRAASKADAILHAMTTAENAGRTGFSNGVATIN